jgi:glycosyltransferase involved in cell wall biosynthesis
VTEPRGLRAAMTLEQSWHRVPGGTAVAALSLARALAARDDVEVVGVAARHRAPAPPPWSPPVPVRHLPLPRLALYESWHYLRRPAVQLATGPVHVVHATTLALPPPRAPLVVTVHDLAWRRHPDMFTRRGVRFFERGLALARTDAALILCSSRATLGDCRTAGFDEARLRLVPLGVDSPSAADSEVKRVRGRYELTRPYVLWTGTVEPRKNLRGLLRAFADLDHEIDLALAGPRGWNEDLEGLVARAPDRVKVLGYVPQQDLAPLYKGAEVFCFPSLTEGFGLPVLEAMAQGTPVVTSKGTSTEELGEGAAVLIEPADPDSIRAGLQHALNDQGLRRRLKTAGPRRAGAYTWERTAELVAAAYREAAC